jgi:hypothetical protein
MDVFAASSSLLDESLEASFGDAGVGGNSSECMAFELCFFDSLAGDGSSMMGV